MTPKPCGGPRSHRSDLHGDGDGDDFEDDGEDGDDGDDNEFKFRVCGDDSDDGDAAMMAGHDGHDGNDEPVCPHGGCCCCRSGKTFTHSAETVNSGMYTGRTQGRKEP